MPYNYTPRSEEELLELAPEGIYHFTVIASEERQSKTSGIQMACLVIKFTDHSGRTHEIKDYLSYMPKMDWKIKHLCDTCGKQDRWGSGVFNAENSVLEGWEGTVKVGVDKTGERPQNKVKDYVSGSADKAAASVITQTNSLGQPVNLTITPANNVEKDDDLPF